MNELSKQQEEILVFINELQNSGMEVGAFKEAVSEEFSESDNALTPEDAYDALEKNDYIDNDFGLTLKGKQYLDSMKTRKEREEKMMQRQTIINNGIINNGNMNNNNINNGDTSSNNSKNKDIGKTSKFSIGKIEAEKNTGAETSVQAKF